MAPNLDVRICALCSVLFQNYFCREEEVPAAEIPRVQPGKFLEWLRNHYSLEQYAICEQAGVPHNTWAELFEQIVHSPVGSERLTVVWPMIVLANRAIPRHTVQSVHTIMLLTWADGNISVTSSLGLPILHKEEANSDGAIAAAVLQGVKTSCLDAILENGLDGLHDMGVNHRGPMSVDPYELLCGIIHKGIKALEPELAQYGPFLAAYLQLIRRLIRPPLPPAVIAQIDLLNKQDAEEHRAVKPVLQATPSQATGGFATDNMP